MDFLLNHFMSKKKKKKFWLLYEVARSILSNFVVAPGFRGGQAFPALLLCANTQATMISFY